MFRLEGSAVTLEARLIMASLSPSVSSDSHAHAAKAPSAWQHTRNALRNRYGQAVFSSWLAHLNYVKISGTELILSAPTRFIRQWVLNHYEEAILACYLHHDDKVRSLTITVQPVPHHTGSVAALHEDTVRIASGVDVSHSNVDILPSHREEFSSPLDIRYQFPGFVCAQSNQLAYQAAQLAAEGTHAHLGSNTLFLHGGVGLGKTHLLHAIAQHVLARHPRKKVLYLSAERFMYKFIQSLQNNQIMLFKEHLRQADMLLLDDLQFLCGKENTQEEFFQTFNALMDHNKQVILSSDRSPFDLYALESRMRSRLAGGMVVDIKPADAPLRAAILQKKLSYMPHIAVPADVVHFIADRITSNIRELEGGLNKVLAFAALTKKEVTMTMARDALHDLLRAHEKQVTVEEIKHLVAKYYGIRAQDFTLKTRARAIARPRQVAMYLAKTHTDRSLAEIGKKFAGKDHSTVLYAVKKIQQLMAQDGEMQTDMLHLNRIIANL